MVALKPEYSTAFQCTSYQMQKSIYQQFQGAAEYFGAACHSVDYSVITVKKILTTSRKGLISRRAW